MTKSIIFLSLVFGLANCSSDAGEKPGSGWTLGQNNGTNNGAKNNGVTVNNNGVNNGFTANNGFTSNNGSTISPTTGTGTTNGQTTNNQTTNNATTGGGGATTHAECNLNSECSNGLFCCPQGFQGGPGTCESRCQMNGGMCGGNHSECNEPTEGCCQQVNVCSERCAENPPGDTCTTNPDCSNGQKCCPNFGGGQATCADDCGGGGRIGGICATDADCGGATAACCSLPVGTDKVCLAQCF